MSRQSLRDHFDRSLKNQNLKETHRGGLAHKVLEKNKDIPRQHNVCAVQRLLIVLTQLCSDRQQKDLKKGSTELMTRQVQRKQLSSLAISTTEEELTLYTGTTANVF